MFNAKFLALAVVSIFVVTAVSGCASGAKKRRLEQELRDRVSECETELQMKEEEINHLREALAEVLQEKESTGQLKTSSPKVGKPSTKDIQTALKNAGFNPGAIDGKMGNQTREAIKAFQKANGLVADGKVGPKTWSILSNYIENKIK